MALSLAWLRKLGCWRWMGALLLKRWINCRTLPRLGSANLVRPRRCLTDLRTARLAIAKASAGIGACIHRKSQKTPVHLPKKEKTSELGRII